MPAGNGTGPMGAGPMTGRGMGTCAGYTPPENLTRRGRLGCGMGRGMGLGFRNRFFAKGADPQTPASRPISKEEQVAALKEQQAHIQQQIDALGDAE